jgi:predicted acyltransferase
MLILAICVWIIDFKECNKLAHPFVIFGTNSIFLFVASGLWVKTMLIVHFSMKGKSVSGYKYLYETIFQPLAGDINGSLLFALAHVFMWWLVLYWMHRKKIFIKI